jgi:4-cresol dehydrogenase (hydroxylating)
MSIRINQPHLQQIESQNIETAKSAWRTLLGTERMKDDPSTIARYSRSTSSHEIPPLAILFPKETSEVQAIAQIANQHRVPIHPISRGRNWGYGDAAAPTIGQVIVDLSKMNRILELDEELGYVRIEPGVTQGQLYAYLEEQNSSLWMDSTAAGPEASIVGNTLDRGFGHTRYGDRSQNCCGLSVVLPDGRLVKTGFSHINQGDLHKVYRGGVGPSLDGLFFQSNLGIVTEMGVWLMPKPKAFSAFFINSQNEADLNQIIDRLAPLKRQGLLSSAIHIANDLRILSGRTRYPWERTKGVTPLPSSVQEDLRKEYGVGAWVVCGAIYGTNEVVKAVKKALRQELGHLKPIFLDDNKMRLAAHLEKFLSYFGLGHGLKQKIESARPILDLLKGKPTKEVVHGGEWRLKNLGTGQAHMIAGRDPIDSPAGLMWISPILPMTGRAAQEVLDILKKLYGKFGFDTLVTFTMITDRALCCVSNIAYDKRDASDVSKAKACYQEAYEALLAAGYVPYRSGPTGYGYLESQSHSAFWDFTRELKTAIDPNGILSPGRYNLVAHSR